METLELTTPAYDVTSAEFVEDLLTSPILSKSADAARNSLLDQLYSGTITTHSLYDIVSLTKSPFNQELKDIQDSETFSLEDHRELADTLFAASSNVANYLGLDLAEAIEKQKHMTIYGRSPLDGIANMLVTLGAGTFDQK